MSIAELIMPGRLVAMMAMFALGLIAIFVETIPLGLDPTSLPSPDLLFCVVAYWALRRPEAAPLISVFALGLLRDLLTDQPIGAGALCLVIAAEFLKGLRQKIYRDGFVMEWAIVTGAAALIVSALWLVELISLSQPPYLSAILYQSLLTAAVYPGVVLVLRWILRIRWKRPELV